MMKQQLLFLSMLLTIVNNLNGSQELSKQEATETKTDKPEKKPLSAKSQEVEDEIMKVIEKWNKVFQNRPQ